MKNTIACKSCSAKIATETDGRIVISDMRPVSSVEVISDVVEIKCRGCGNWNTFSKSGQTINYKRKGQDALYNSSRK